MAVACLRGVLIDARRNPNLGVARPIRCLADVLTMRLTWAQAATIDQVMKDVVS